MSEQPIPWGWYEAAKLRYPEDNPEMMPYDESVFRQEFGHVFYRLFYKPIVNQLNSEMYNIPCPFVVYDFTKDWHENDVWVEMHYVDDGRRYAAGLTIERAGLFDETYMSDLYSEVEALIRRGMDIRNGGQGVFDATR